MKFVLAIIISLMTLFPLKGQDISESIINFKEKFYTLFSGESAILSIEYIKTYSINGTDTTNYFILDIKNQNLELANISLVSTIFDLNWALASSRDKYSINKSQNKSILEKEKFLEFYECINKVYSFIAKTEKFKESENSIVATCSVENISIGGEYDPNKFARSRVIFYFKVGEDVTFQMRKDQIESILKVLRDIKNNWISKD
jgi:hypothetical protein